MKIEYRIGDMFDSPSGILAHGANAQGVMRSGVAKTMVERHYAAFRAYKHSYDVAGLQVGEVVFAQSKDRFTGASKLIANCITQKDYGRDPLTLYVSYDGIRGAVRTINDYVRMYFVGREQEMDCLNGKPTVTFPLIGAGLANGDWGLIAEIIEEESTYFQPIVYAYSQADMDRAMKAVAVVQSTRIGELRGSETHNPLVDSHADESASMNGSVGDSLAGK